MNASPAHLRLVPAEGGAGRLCPYDYRYSPRVFARAPDFAAETLYVIGGLYGNLAALAAVEKLAARERTPVMQVFNGDFHWFDAEPATFEAIDDAVLSFDAIRGNVETELALPADDAGCGCGYPEWVDDGTVERSNRILVRLREAAGASGASLARLAALPMNRVGRVGTSRVAVVHGDADSLAGWGFSQEALATKEGAAAAEAGA